MKKLLMPFALLTGLLTVQTVCHAQPPQAVNAPMPGDAAGPVPPPPPPADPQGGPRGPGRVHPGLGEPEQALLLVTSFSGRVSRLTFNEEYVYDGFSLYTGTDSFLVHFNPAIGSKLLKVLKPGATVTVAGAASANPGGKKQIELVSLTSGSQTVGNEPVAGDGLPPAPEFVSGKGKVTALQADPGGRENGLLLDGDRILRIRAKAMAALSQQVATGAVVSYTGEQKPRRAGEALAADYRIVDCRTITVNGQAYLVR